MDLDDAFSWYELRQSGLGDVFLSSVEACFVRLRREPEIYPLKHARVRRARVHRFPYWVYFVVRSSHIDVLAVYHERRKPRSFRP